MSFSAQKGLLDSRMKTAGMPTELLVPLLCWVTLDRSRTQLINGPSRPARILRLLGKVEGDL